MTDIPTLLQRILALSTADGCIAIARREAALNVRWAGNTVTTNGVTDELSLAVISIVGRRVGTITRTAVPDGGLEALVRQSEAAAAALPEAPDYMRLVEGTETPAAWDAPAAPPDLARLETFTPRLAGMLSHARSADLPTFGYAQQTDSTVWVSSSTGLRRRHNERLAKVEMTGKTPDFAASTWAGEAGRTLADIEPGLLLDRVRQRLSWSARRMALPAGEYEVLFAPSCTADLAIVARYTMTRREADEGRSPYARAGGGTRLGERLFGDLTMWSDPMDADVPAAPFHVGTGSGSMESVFDNGLTAGRVDWVRDGVLHHLVAPRYWAERVGAAAVPSVDNLIVDGGGATLEDMIADTERALLVTSLWYIRTVDPQTALQTGLTRDGVFLVERGQVAGAVNNFRWNMSPIAAFAQTTQIGRTGMALPRENDEFLRAKAPPVRIARFHMSSVSEAS